MDDEMKENVPAVERVAIKETVQNGNRVLAIDDSNHFYSRSKVKVGRAYWYCQNRSKDDKCNVTAFTKESDPGFIYVKGQHCHVSNVAKATAVVLEAKLVERAVQNPSVKPRILFSDLVSTPGLHRSEVLALSGQEHLAKRIHRERSKFHVSAGLPEPKNFLQLHELMPEDYKVTSSGSKLLSYIGFAEEETQSLGFMVFCSDFGRDLLNRSTHWISDGTFKLPNGIFEQVNT